MMNTIKYSLDDVEYTINYYYALFNLVEYGDKMVYFPRKEYKPLDISLVSYDDLIRCFKMAKSNNLIEVKPDSRPNPKKNVDVVVCWEGQLRNNDSNKLICYEESKWRTG